MNNITKLAVGTSVLSLSLLLLVFISKAAYPDHVFIYGTGLGLLLMFISLLLYAAGWGCDFFHAFKQKNTYGILILVIAAVLFIIPILLKYGLG